MNPLFENIFEKYNIRCEVPKRRYRSPKILTQSCSFYKKSLNISSDASFCKILDKKTIPNNSQIRHFQSSCYFNANTKGKYYSPTRYKTLEIVGVNHNKTTTRSSSLSKRFGEDDSSGKESFNELNCHVSCNPKSFAGIESDLSCKADNAGHVLQNNLMIDSIGGINNCKTNYRSENLTAIDDEKGFPRKQFSVTSINARTHFNASFEKMPEQINVSLNDSNNSSEMTFTESFEITDAAHPVENNCTELDLLLELIDREERNEKYKRNRKFLKCDDCLPPTKTCRKGGVQEMFERALKQEKAKSNFLKYDKKVGLRTGHLLTVAKIETSYGLTLATVKSKELGTNIGVVVTQEMAPRLKLGTQIEAFFDDKSLPYKLQLSGECLDVYLEPLKLIIV